MDPTRTIDDILSKPEPTNEAAAAPSVVSEQPSAVAPVASEGEVKQRDERGRFAGIPAKPVATEAALSTGAPSATPPVAAQPVGHEPGYVPIAALVDTRLKAREAERRAEKLERELAEFRKPKEQAPVDFFADPDAAIRQAIAPYQSELQKTRQEFTLAISRTRADATHGAETVAAMEAAVGKAMEEGDPEVQQLGVQMLQSQDPVGVAMAWYQRRSVLSEVGTDPAAYREKLRAEIRAEMEAGGAAPAVPAAPPPVMPSNLAKARNVGVRSGPAWQGPKAIADIFARR